MGAVAARPAPTSTLTTSAIPAQRSTRLRRLPTSRVPRPMATSLTAAISIPKRLPAEATKATCTATVTRPNPPGGRVCPRRIWTPSAARTPATRPTTFRAVPVRSVRSSLTPSPGSRGERLSQVAKAAQALFHLALLFRGVRAYRLRHGRAAPLRVRLEADCARDLLGEVRERDLRAFLVRRDPLSGEEVDALGAVVSGEPVGGRDHVPGARQAVQRGRLEEKVGRLVEIWPGEDLLLARHVGDRVRTGLRVFEREQAGRDLVPHTLVVSPLDRPVRLAANEVDRDAFPGRDDAGVGPRLPPVERRRRHGHTPVQAELVVEHARHRPHAAP